MAHKNDIQGSCLCKAVTLQIAGFDADIGCCHCGMCRKWSGGPFFAVKCESGITLEGSENVSIYESSDWAERGFCGRCGTHLFYRLKNSSEYHISAGVFDSNEDFNFEHQIFIDKKPNWYEFSNNTKNMTEAEVFAL